MHRASARLSQMVLCAFFVALTAVCSQIQIPLPLIPINLALFSVFVCGALLGPLCGLAAMVAYTLLAAVGVPVLSGFAGGLSALLGPTGGYVLGYILCAAVTGLWVRRFGSSLRMLFAGMVLGLLSCYVPGTLWFMLVTGRGVVESLGLCVLPFLPGDAIKIVLAALLTRRLQAPYARILAR